jgi:PAS domain S-box-containing protein
MDPSQRELLLQAVFENAPIGIAIADSDGRFVEVNPAFLEMLGCSREEACRMTFIDITHPDDRPATLRLSEEFRNGRTHSYRQEKRYVARDGAPRWARVQVTALRDASGAVRFWLNFMEHITDRIQAEPKQPRLAAQVPQSQKMETPGTLVGGMAHDLNNLLMAIQGNISLLGLNKDPHHRDATYLKKIETAVQRASDLTSRIAGFARGAKPPEPPQPAPTARQAAAEATRTVLLVEDEEMVADIGRQMLERLGYRTLMARSGDEALALYEQRQAEIDLVILDMIMPGMGGGAVFDRIRSINPQALVLLSSGYSLTGQALDILNRGCRGFIQKPFSIDQLEQKLKEVLSAG